MRHPGSSCEELSRNWVVPSDACDLASSLIERAGFIRCTPVGGRPGGYYRFPGRTGVIRVGRTRFASPQAYAHNGMLVADLFFPAVMVFREAEVYRVVCSAVGRYMVEARCPSI